MGFSFFKLNQYLQEQNATVSVIAPIQEILPYTEIKTEDITTIRISKKMVDEFQAVNPSEVIGKISTVTLYPNRPIDKRYLEEKSKEFQNYQVVGIRVSASRFAGVTEGSIVDVYWLSGNTNQPAAATLIASDAEVIKISDGIGRNIKASVIAGSENLQLAEPRIVFLKVKPEEVPYLVNGSLDSCNFISLVNKGSRQPTLKP